MVVMLSTLTCYWELGYNVPSQYMNFNRKTMQQEKAAASVVANFRQMQLWGSRLFFPPKCGGG